MGNDEINMTEKESMELIASMINKAKNEVGETGWLYLLWGWLILFCCISQFVGIYFFHFDQIYFVWFLTWILLAYQFLYLSKERKKRKVKTYTREINTFVWVVFIICMMLVMLISSRYGHLEMMDPLLLAMYGMPTFLSGIILKFKPLVTGGILCWILSAVSLFIPFEYQLLLVAAAVIAAWIIPGYLLRKRFYRNLANQSNGV
jgi:hypothetical protein